MISNDDYSKLLDQQFETKTNISANKIISGTILKVSDQFVTVDIGYKSEGQIPKEEFLNTGSSDDLKEGQAIEVFIEKFLIESKLNLPKSFVLDIGCGKNENWFIIELNSSWGARLNSCNPKKILKCIQEATVK